MNLRIFRLLGAVICLTLMTSPMSFAAYQGHGAEGLPAFVKSPQDIEKWFSGSFKYQMKIPDAPQTPKQTIELRAGDCDDFASLASAALFKMGISNDVLLIKIRDLDIRHAICLWRDQDGTYSFFSNQQLIRTHESDRDVAIRKYFRSFEKITSLSRS